MVDSDIHGQWFEFFTQKFIPQLKTKSGFDNIVFTRVLSEQVEKHFTYSLQIHLDSITDYKQYQDEIFNEYIDFADPIFGSKVLYFTSLLKKIDCL